MSLATTVILLCGGSGSRMNIAHNKSCLNLNGKPLFAHSLKVFRQLDWTKDIIVVYRKEDHDLFHTEHHNLLKNVTLVEGGPRRQDSVSNALQAITATTAMIMVHDAARPFVEVSHVQALADCMDNKNYAGAILATPVTDTLKRAVTNSTNEPAIIADTQARDQLWTAQTPQLFRKDLFLNTMAQVIDKDLHITDDASSMEMMGHNIALVQGSRNNIKITYPEDYVVAKLMSDNL